MRNTGTCVEKLTLLLAEAKKLGKLDVEKAVELYRQAMGKTKESEFMDEEEYFKGLATELCFSWRVYLRRRF